MIIDISPVIDSTIAVWPGDTPFTHTRSLDIARGDHLTLSDIRTTLHVGAHADAPGHYAAGGTDIASRPLEHFIGRCQVIEVAVSRGERVLPRHVTGIDAVPPRILFKTGTFPDHRSWNDDFASLSPEIADWLHERGVVLVGIDTPSVDPFDSKALEAHHALGRHDITNLEGLVLAHVTPGVYELIAAPLPLRHADASPVRALLRTLD